MPTRLILLTVLALVLTACSKPAGPDIAPEPLLSEVPLAGYTGGDETVYFLVTAPDGTQDKFEAGFIKDGKLTLSAGDPPATLQHQWLDTIPDGATGLEYSEGAEKATAAHVTAILIGDTGLMVAGTTGLAPASNEDESPMVFAGLTWTNMHFDASFYLQHNDSLVNMPHLDGYTTFGLNGNGLYSDPDLASFIFNAEQYLGSNAPAGSLLHPYFQQPAPAPEPGDEEPGDEEPELPVEAKAVIYSPVNHSAFIDEVIIFSAAGSTGEGELTFEWSLGNGSERITTTELTISASYQHAGEFTFTLTVMDEADQSATATGAITVIDPNIVTHQVQNYTGDEEPIGISVFLSGGDLASLVMGTIDSSGLITINLGTAVPDAYLMPVNDIFPDALYTEADVNGLFAGPGIAFMAGDVPEPGEPFPTLITAVNRADYPSNPDFNEGDALGFYVYTDQAVNILLAPGISSSGSVDLGLAAGWNFVSMQLTATGMHLTNADPAGYYWFEMAMDPEPEIAGISFGESEWFANPGGVLVPTVNVQFDHGGETWFDPSVFGPLTWDTSNASVATVNSEGHVLAHTDGTAVITAQYGVHIAELAVFVGTGQPDALLFTEAEGIE